MNMYTLSEISGLLSVTEQSIRKYIKDGLLKARKIGGKWMISEENLKQYLNG